MTSPLTENPRSWLAAHAAIIVGHLRDNGFDEENAVQRQVLNLAEEAGEVVGAYRRLIGWARRSGTRGEFHREVADVVVTAYVLAEEDGFDLDAAISDKLQTIYSRGWREPIGGAR